MTATAASTSSPGAPAPDAGGGGPAPGTRPLAARARAVLRYDLPASLVVFLVALPLSTGIAVASDAPVAAGIVAAVVGGVVAGALGGSPLQVSGPAAGLTVVVAELVAQFGWRTTCAITVCAGALQVVLGLSRVARAALAISPVVVHAMLAGIGITIAAQQVHVLLGGQAADSVLDAVLTLPAAVAGLDPTATLLGLVVVVLLLGWRRVPPAVRRVPGPLVAVVVATLLASLVGAQVERVGLPESIFDAITTPLLPDGQWPAFAAGVLTITAVASVESLLSAVAVDKMHDGPRARLDRELVGQGAANLVSGGVGGLAVTGVIVRSATNVTSGARTRASAVLHGLWVLLFAVVLIGVVELVPFAVLAGLLVVIGAQLVKWADIRTARRTGDLPVYLVTVLGVTLLNLLEGVLLGLALAALLVLRRVVRASVRAEEVSGTWHVRVRGSLTFLSVPRLDRVLREVPDGADVRLELGVDYLDRAAFDALTTWRRRHATTGALVEVVELGAAGLADAEDAVPTRETETTVRPGPTPAELAATRAGGMAPWRAWEEAERARYAPTSVAEEPVALRPVLTGVERYHRDGRGAAGPRLSALASGQAPDTLFITCADSRVVPDVITSSGPGDLFTVRNIGNLVPTGRRRDAGRRAAESSVEAALQYGVGVLGVTSVVVCGHSGCGAMAALLGDGADGALGDWLVEGEESVRQLRADHPVARSAAAWGWSEVDRLAAVNVAVQVRTLQRHPVVGAAVAEGRLSVAGLLLHLPSGSVWRVGAHDVRPLADAHDGLPADLPAAG